MKRRRAREFALQMLFQLEFNADQKGLGDFWRDKQEEDPKVVEFANDLVKGTVKHLEEVDQAIVKAAANWDLDRMAAVDRNILRAAAYELLYRPDVPPAVTINEALEIAKKFSSNESSAFINGILDAIANQKK